MSEPGRAKLDAALAECALHAQVLGEVAVTLPAAFSVDAVASIDTLLQRALDQAAYRFMKLQDSLGEKVLPGLLIATLDPLPPEATFAEKLQRLERLGAVTSAERWRHLREVRNSLAHEYPDHPAFKAAGLTRMVQGVKELLQFWATVQEFSNSRIG